MSVVKAVSFGVSVCLDSGVGVRVTSVIGR